MEHLEIFLVDCVFNFNLPPLQSFMQYVTLLKRNVQTENENINEHSLSYEMEF